MRIALFLFVLIFPMGFVNAQSFPTTFLGHWKGSLEIYSGAKKTMTISVGLDVTKTDTSGRYNWVITYGDSNQDIRPYKLVAIDSTKGHWAIDEQNGIIIDMYATGNKVSTLFVVMGSSIMISYWIEKGEMFMELYSFPEKPGITT